MAHAPLAFVLRLPLSTDGLQAAMERNSTSMLPPRCGRWSGVETHGCGFLHQAAAPKILFRTAQVLPKHSGGQYDATAPDVSNPIPGGIR